MTTFDLTDEHRRNLAYPQQEWRRDVHRRFVARFAGHRLVAMPNSRGTWILRYLGFCSPELATVVTAQQAAPDFARQVLAHMAVLIDECAVPPIVKPPLSTHRQFAVDVDDESPEAE